MIRINFAYMHNARLRLIFPWGTMRRGWRKRVAMLAVACRNATQLCLLFTGR